MKNIRPPYVTLQSKQNKNLYITLTGVTSLFVEENSYKIKCLESPIVRDMPTSEYELINASFEVVSKNDNPGLFDEVNEEEK